MLKENSRGEIVFEHPLFETKGVASSDVLSEIMGTDTIPPIKEAEWVSRYTQLLDLDQTDSDEALEIKKNLISHFGEQHPINRNFERMQRLKVFKNTLLKK
jgi:predicted ATP-binding protein involved in virulence